MNRKFWSGIAILVFAAFSNQLGLTDGWRELFGIIGFLVVLDS